MRGKTRLLEFVRLLQLLFLFSLTNHMKWESQRLRTYPSPVEFEPAQSRENLTMGECYMVSKTICRRYQRCQSAYSGITPLPSPANAFSRLPQLARHRCRVRRRIASKRLLPPGYATYRLNALTLIAFAVVTLVAVAPRSVSGAAPPMCPPSVDDNIQVESAADLAGVVERTNCSKGNFTLTWRGEVFFEEPLVVGNSTTLIVQGEGAGAVLNGGGVTRLFEAAEGSTLIFENVELRNGSAPSLTGGGGAIVSDGAGLTVQATSCNFTANTSPADGGVILSTGGFASMEFNDCRFEGNFAEHSGGVLRANSATLLSAKNSVFLGNAATSVDEYGFGGVVYLSGGQPETVLERCEFRGNNASHYGGAVYHEAAGNLTLLGTTVAMNWARYGGGGIRTSGDIQQVNVFNSVFEDNVVFANSSWDNSFNGGGFSVFSQSTVAEITIRSSNFFRNLAKNGGGLAMQGNLIVNIQDSLFEDNLASARGGGVYVMSSKNSSFEATVTNATFLGNGCTGWGGAVHSYAEGSGNLSFVHTSFTNNFAAYRDDETNATHSYRGGAYSAVGTDLFTSANGCVFEGNRAGAVGGELAVGGAVAVDGGTFFTWDCDFSNNTAYNGGAINAAGDENLLVQDTPDIVVSGGSMRHNIALEGYCYTGLSNQDYCGHGGALHAELGAWVKLSDVVFEENSAGFGGAISVSNGSRASCTGVNFSSNSAVVAGGAVQVWSNDSYFVSEESIFLGNKAQRPGAYEETVGLTVLPSTSSLSSSLSSSVTSVDSSYVSSGPTRDPTGASGGAISVTDGGLVSLKNSTMSKNQADGRGGAVICGDGTNLNFSSVDFSDHKSGVARSSQAHGGACAAVGGCQMRLEESNFDSNRAPAASGGAVSVEGGSEVFALHCTFVDNHANGGGAVYGSGSGTAVSLELCSLERNSADKEGGALTADGIKELSVESCSFYRNYANDLGGGIHCYECALKATNCSFERNTASGDGGAIWLSYADDANVQRCSFTENKAKYDGGAIAVDPAVGQVIITDKTDNVVQAQNGTDSDSGSDSVEALAKLYLSDTSFLGNIAGERGGSIYSTSGSSMELRDCNSTSNSAALGGSLYMSSSSYVLTDCLFRGDFNSVLTDATIFAVESTIQAREVTFSDTHNASSMVAIFAGSSTSLEAQNCSFVGWIGSNVVLADNTGNLILDSCDFSGSTAQSLVAVEDGEDVTLAIVRNARLGTANYEAVDYRAEELSAGVNTSTFGTNLAGCDSSECASGCEEGDLGVYCECYEMALSVSETCLSDAGKLNLSSTDKEVFTMYPDEPVTKLRLEVNGSEDEDEGPVLWKLDWDDTTALSWEALPSTGLAYPGDPINICLRGTVKNNWNGESKTEIIAKAPYQESVEPSSVMVNATFYYCAKGKYWDGVESECIACARLGLNPHGVACDDQGILLETLPLMEGFWRADIGSKMIRECFNDDACVGSTNDRISTVNDYCADGYTGPCESHCCLYFDCAVCMEGFSIGVSHTCHSCDSSFRAGMVVIMALTGVLMIVGIVIVINDLVGNPALTDLSETHFSAISRRLRKVPFHKLKIPLVVFQIMVQYAAITSIEFPSVFQSFLTAISVINLDLGWLFGAVCIIDLNFHGRLLAATIGPFVVLLVLLGTYIYTCQQHGLRRPTREAANQSMQSMYPMFRTSPRSSDSDSEYSVIWRVQDKHVTVAVTIAFLLYSTVSTIIFQTFACDELEDVDSRHLRADYSIDCDSDQHQAFQIYAAAMILVYPIGIPVVFFVLLFRKRRLINPPQGVHPDIVSLSGGNINDDNDEENNPDPRLLDRRIAQTSFLWQAYRPGAYYFEVLECFRRLLLTGCLVFILPNSAGQAAVACILAVLTVGIFAVVNPYSDPNDHRAYTLGALVIFLTMFMGLVVKVDLADEETQSQRILGALLIVLTMGLLVVAVLDCLWEARRLSKDISGDDDDGHVFLRRRESKSKSKEKEMEKEQLADEKWKMGDGGALYAPKLLDVPINRTYGAKPDGAGDGLDGELEGEARHGMRQRGSQMFVQSASANPRYRPHVAIAGTSSQLHPSGGGTMVHLSPQSSSQPQSIFSEYRDSLGSPSVAGVESVATGADEAAGVLDGAVESDGAVPGMKPAQYPSAFYSPPKSTGGEQDQEFGHEHGRKSGERSEGLVPAEAEGTPEGMGAGVLNDKGDGGKQSSVRSKKGSKSSKSKSSRRKSKDGHGHRRGSSNSMQPAGPTDEMRPSPDPDDVHHQPSPWMS